MMAAFTLQEEEILCRADGASGQEAQGTGCLFWIRMKSNLFYFFSNFLIQAFLNSYIRRIPKKSTFLTKSAEIVVSELLKLQNDFGQS